jgi:hypothetical protein
MSLQPSSTSKVALMTAALAQDTFAEPSISCVQKKQRFYVRIQTGAHTHIQDLQDLQIKPYTNTGAHAQTQAYTHTQTHLHTNTRTHAYARTCCAR